MNHDAADGPDVASLERAEIRLQRAQADSDVVALDRLLHADLIYVAPDGTTGGKSDDLDGHRSGAMRIDSLESIDVVVRIIDGVGFSVLTADLDGDFAGAPFAARLRYTRTWVLTDGRWQVIAAHIAEVRPDS